MFKVRLVDCWVHRIVYRKVHWKLQNLFFDLESMEQVITPFYTQSVVKIEVFLFLGSNSIGFKISGLSLFILVNDVFVGKLRCLLCADSIVDLENDYEHVKYFRSCQ